MEILSGVAATIMIHIIGYAFTLPMIALSWRVCNAVRKMYLDMYPIHVPGYIDARDIFHYRGMGRVYLTKYKSSRR
jgi:hypothetical protein